MSAPDLLTQIISRLSDSKVAQHACLVICPDMVRQSRVVQRITAGLATNAERRSVDASVTNEDGFKKIFFSLQNSSLFTSETHLIIHSIDALSAAAAKTVTSLIKQASPSTVVIGCAGKLNSTLALYKFFDQVEMLFSLPELAGLDLEQWIAKELVQSGVKNFPPAATSIIRQASQDSPDTAFDTIQKIALYLDGDTLTLEDLKLLVPVEGRVDEFDFISRIATSPRARLELMISRLLDQGVSPFPLLGLLHRNYASYHALNQLLKSGMSPEQSARAIDSPPWLVKKIAPLAQRYTLPNLKIALGAIARADSLLKNRSLGAEGIMSELLESLTP